MTQGTIELLHAMKGIINHVRINFFSFFQRQYVLPETPLLQNEYGTQVLFWGIVGIICCKVVRWWIQIMLGDIKNQVMYLYIIHKTLIQIRLCPSKVYSYCKAAACVSQDIFKYLYITAHVWISEFPAGLDIGLSTDLNAPRHFFGSWQSELSQEQQRHSLGNKMAHDPSKHDQPVLRSSCGTWPQKQRTCSGPF